MKGTKNSLQNIQLYPSDSFKIATDNLTRKLFEMCFDEKESLDIEIIESNYKHIKINVQISNFSDLKIKLGEFDWAVFNAVISERNINNEYTTAAIIARKLGASHTPTKDIQNAIICSLEKFAVIRIAADFPLKPATPAKIVLLSLSYSFSCLLYFLATA